MKPIYNILLTLVMASMASACHKGDELETPVPVPIAFNSDVQEQSVTRANNGLFNYQKSMKLYGTKTVGGNVKEVFPNYRLNYLDDAQAWEYESVNDDDLPSGQIVKYWDYDATGYDFLAGAPFDKTEISADGKKVTLNGLQMEWATGYNFISTPYLYSEPKHVAITNFGDPVMLNFHLGICRVKVAFIFKTPQTESVTLTGIQFEPSAQYTNNGSLTVDYSGSTPEYTVVPNMTSSDALDYSNLTINSPGNATAAYCDEIYYMIPLSTDATAGSWTMKVGSLTENNTAVVPATYMKWEPGHAYVYVFQLSSAKKDPTIKFIECLNTAITGWEDATSDNVTLYNW